MSEPTSLIDPATFRAAMGRFATGVTIVSTEVDESVHGMTANAFLSVSLDPPLILVSIATRARMHGHLAVGQPFGVSVLAEAQQTLSNHFAGRVEAASAVAWTWQADAPLLVGASAQIAARVVAAHPAGDHTLFIGQVEYLAHDEQRPLIFHAGRYAQLAA